MALANEAKVGSLHFPRALSSLFLAVGLALALPVGVGPCRGGDAERMREGVFEGAGYLISVPKDWNGGLVMFAHGYEGEGPGSGTVHPSPLDFYLREHGYAWAASGYRSRGYRPDWFLADTLALRGYFIKAFGSPRWTIIHGQSMGGHVGVASLELHPEIYQGALLECGVVDGVGLVDWLFAYTAAAQYFSQLPLLDTPRPEFDALANGQWLTLMGTPGNYTQVGERFDNVVMHLAGGVLPLRLQGLKQRYVQNLNPRDPGPGRAQEFSRHADTRAIRYEIDPGHGLDATQLNASVPRVVPAAGARSREANPVFAEFSGRIEVPMITLHETGDFRAPFRLEQDYFRRVRAAGKAHLLVQRAVRWTGHCGIDSGLRERSFGDLVAWIERGVVPKGDDVLGDPSKLGLDWSSTLHPDDPARRR
jgi:pimeloyl-ACP methyl ester carboxylesterase